MECFKCHKEMGRTDGGPTLEGIEIKVIINDRTPENVGYNRRQLGKYGDSRGDCDIAICFECHIDALFSKVVLSQCI